MDRLIAQAGAAGLKVELDLSTYRNLLLRHGVNPYTADWGAFVRFVTGRRNTVTKRLYANDASIALVAFAGEVEPPGSRGLPVRYTTKEVTSFFARTLQQWRARDPHHLLTTGGLLHLDYASGIDWVAIYSLPVVDVVTIHVYSAGDQAITQPNVAGLSRSLGKPWLTEEFGKERAAGDAARAGWFAQVYADQLRYGSAGTAFWNLGPQTTSPTYDVNSSTPLTLAVVTAAGRPALPRALSQLLAARGRLLD